LRASDFVSLHVPHTPGPEGRMGPSQTPGILTFDRWTSARTDANLRCRVHQEASWNPASCDLP
jgi:hypothetical protein